MRGMILALAVSLAVLFMAGEGRADFFDGQKLNNLCSSDYLKSLGFCDGYVLGVFDAGKVVDKDIRKRHWKGGWSAACLPPRRGPSLYQS